LKVKEEENYGISQEIEEQNVGLKKRNRELKVCMD